MEFSILNFAIPRIAGSTKEDLSFQHKKKNGGNKYAQFVNTQLHENKSEESAPAIMILEAGKTELRNLKFKHHTFCNLGNSIHM